MSRHQKRVTVPRSWPIARKSHKWVAKASPGPHSSEDSMPLGNGDQRHAEAGRQLP